MLQSEDGGLVGYSVGGFLFKGSASPWYPHRFSILMRIIGKMGAFSMRSLKTDVSVFISMSPSLV